MTDVTLTAPVHIGGLPGRVDVTLDDENGDATRATVDLHGDYHQNGDPGPMHLCARGTWETTALADALELAAHMLRAGQHASRQLHATTRRQNPPNPADTHCGLFATPHQPLRHPGRKP
jgi:hypothetical protein